MKFEASAVTISMAYVPGTVPASGQRTYGLIDTVLSLTLTVRLLYYATVLSS
jgi:hypothetical protein